MTLNQRKAIVTGGSSGIGRSIAIEFGREGAAVVVADIQEAPRQGKYHEKDVTTTTVDELTKLGAPGHFIQTDMADDAQVQRLIDQSADRLGGIDILVNNAGICFKGDSQTLSIDDWDRTIAINLRGVFVVTKFAVPHLRQSPHGRVIHIASILGYRGGGGQPYCAAKAGLINMARDGALELAPHGVTVNAICPGYIETSLQDYLTPDEIKSFIATIPLGRAGLPRDIARAAVFIASDDAQWITGTSLTVDGGSVCRL